MSRKFLHSGWRADFGACVAGARCFTDARAGRKTASAVSCRPRAGRSDARMSRPADSVFHENRISPWLQTTGGIVAALLLVQLLTGVLLAFYYVPSVDHAHTTVSYIEKVVSSGSWLRSLHHYGSQWLALFAFVHVTRLFWNEAYAYRKAHWIGAVVLLLLVMAAAGTGDFLSWGGRGGFCARAPPPRGKPLP